MRRNRDDGCNPTVVRLLSKLRRGSNSDAILSHKVVLHGGMRENDVLSRYSELMRLSRRRIVVLIGFRRQCATNCTDSNSLPSSSREVFGGSKPGSHGALQHVSPLTTTITTFPFFQLSTLQLRSSATNTWAHLYFTKPPPTPMLALFRSVRHSPHPPFLPTPRANPRPDRTCLTVGATTDS